MTWTNTWEQILGRADKSVDDTDGRKSYSMPDAYRREIWLTSAFERMIGAALPLPGAADNTQRHDWHARIERRGLVDDFMTAVLDEAWPNADLREAFLDNRRGLLIPVPEKASPMSLADALDGIVYGGFSIGDNGDAPPKPDRDLVGQLVTLAAEIRVIAATSSLLIAAEDVLSAADMAEDLKAQDEQEVVNADLKTRIESLAIARGYIQAALTAAKAAIIETDPRALTRLERAWPMIDTSVNTIVAEAPDTEARDLLRLRERCRILLERLTEAQHLTLSELRFHDLFDALKDYLRLLDAGAEAWYIHLRALVIGLRLSILTQSLWREIDADVFTLALRISELAIPEPAMRSRAATVAHRDIYNLEKRLTWLDYAQMADPDSDWRRPIDAIRLELVRLGAGGLGDDGAPVLLDEGLFDLLEDHLMSLNAALRLENRAALRKAAGFLSGMERLSKAMEAMAQRMVGWGVEVPTDG